MQFLKLLPRFWRISRVLDELEAREQWSRTEIEAWQLERVNRLWASAVSRTQYYSELARAGRLPDRFSTLQEFRQRVPRLTKARVAADKSNLLASHRAAGEWHLTGGSTGRSTEIFWEHRAHRESLRMKYRLYQTWGVDPLDKMAFLWGHFASFLPGWRGLVARWQQPVLDRLRSRLRLSAYQTDRDTLRKHLQRIAAFRAVGLYGYASAVYLLAREAIETDFHSPDLKAVFLTSEPVYPDFVAAIERGFGVPAPVEYGSVECGFIAGEARDRTLRVREDHVLVETATKPDGRYDILVTSLANPAFPLIRYEIEDVTDQPLTMPDRGFAVLSSVTGRVNDFLVSAGGDIVTPHLVMHIFEAKIPGLRRFQVHQVSDGTIQVRFEGDRRDSDSWLRPVTRTLEEYTEGRPIEVTFVDELPRSPSGKHRFITSELAPAFQQTTRKPVAQALRSTSL